ncbi:TPA: 50S ribosomal protein L5 [Candidatus Micrarchaeota archaeon]|nr:50S ribosomal protein L5P [uncultured archaeon]HIH19701.1 50S ribosomal protein L5 [Candidatus Micrarchaeota archaeon]
MALNEVFLEKLTLNIGAGEGGQALENARTLLERISSRTPVTTLAKTRNPTFNIRKGDAIGTKVTLRGKPASDVLTRALQAVENKLKEKSFDSFGNVSFGVREYIDFPGVKYDPKIGMLGLDVCVSLRKKGVRIAKRRRAQRKLPRKQVVSLTEASEFMKKTYGVSFE